MRAGSGCNLLVAQIWASKLQKPTWTHMSLKWNRRTTRACSSKFSVHPKSEAIGAPFISYSTPTVRQRLLNTKTSLDFRPSCLELDPSESHLNLYRGITLVVPVYPQAKVLEVRSGGSSQCEWNFFTDKGASLRVDAAAFSNSSFQQPSNFELSFLQNGQLLSRIE